jgi:hypothetical protein
MAPLPLGCRRDSAKGIRKVELARGDMTAVLQILALAQKFRTQNLYKDAER